MSEGIITYINEEPSMPLKILEMLKAAFCNTVDIISTILELF